MKMLNFEQQRYWNKRKHDLERQILMLPERIPDYQEELRLMRLWAAREKELARVDWDKEFESVQQWTGLDPVTKAGLYNWLRTNRALILARKTGEVLIGMLYRCEWLDEEKCALFLGTSFPRKWLGYITRKELEEIKNDYRR